MTNFSYSRNFKGVADVFLRSPKLYKPLLESFETVMVGESELSKGGILCSGAEPIRVRDSHTPTPI